MSEKDKKPKEIHYKVDGENQTTTSEILTPKEILSLAKIDPANHYLVQIKGKERISYDGKQDEKIEMHDGMKFVSVSTGPTPVSR